MESLLVSHSSPAPRAQNPHLIPAEDPLGYTVMDVWDASTPEELHTASYGMWVGSFLRGLDAEDTQPLALLLSNQRHPDLATQVFQVANIPDQPTVTTAYARRLDDGRVTHRAWAHLVLDVPLAAAALLAIQHTLAPVIWLPRPGWSAVVIPPIGPSTRVDVRDATAVSRSLRGYLLEALNPSTIPWELWLQRHGFNPIPEFKRLFERSTP